MSIDDLQEQMQEDLQTLVAGGWFKDSGEEQRFTDLACQIVVDRIKEYKTGLQNGNNTL